MHEQDKAVRGLEVVREGLDRLFGTAGGCHDLEDAGNVARLVVAAFREDQKLWGLLCAYMPSVWAGDESEVTDEEASSMVFEMLGKIEARL